MAGKFLNKINFILKNTPIRPSNTMEYLFSSSQILYTGNMHIWKQTRPNMLNLFHFNKHLISKINILNDTIYNTTQEFSHQNAASCKIQFSFLILQKFFEIFLLHATLNFGQLCLGNCWRIWKEILFKSSLYEINVNFKLATTRECRYLQHNKLIIAGQSEITSLMFNIFDYFKTSMFEQMFLYLNCQTTCWICFILINI
jgi:hypothetical protein